MPKPRFRIKHRAGPAHGGPMALEIEYSWSVIDTKSGKTVLHYEGAYSDAYPYDEENARTGVTDVRLAADGRHVQVKVADGPLKTILIPGAEKLSPCAAWKKPPEFPITIGAVTIEEDTDLTALVNRAYRGKVPSEAETSDREHPPLWIRRLYEWLETTTRGPELALAVGARINDKGPKIRGAVLDFYTVYPFAPGFERVVGLIESDLTGAGATPYPVLGFTSLPGTAPLSVLISRLTRRKKEETRLDVLDRRALKLLKEAVTRADCPWPEPLAKRGSRKKLIINEHLRLDSFKGLLIDEPWLARNIARIEKARPDCPGRWKFVIRALASIKSYDLVKKAGETLLDFGLVTSHELEAWAKMQPYWERRWPQVLKKLAREHGVKTR